MNSREQGITRREEKDRFVSQRMLIKIGTSTLAGQTEWIDRDFLDSVASQVRMLTNSGVKVGIVSSGAVSLGRKRFLDSFDKRIAAAIGQIPLMGTWSDVFHEYGMVTTSRLVSEDDLEYSEGIVNAITQDMSFGVPIINGNDAMNTLQAGLTTGNNDVFVAYLARRMGVDSVLFLTNVEGVFDENNKLIPQLQNQAEINRVCGKNVSEGGNGGMLIKAREAYRLALDGIRVAIAGGNTQEGIIRFAKGERIGTGFCKYP